MRSLLSRLAPVAATLMALALPAATRAQSPTPEGTVITNTATASYTDANSNSYSSVSASASVTVGFAPGVDAVSPASVTPASPSSGNSFTVTLKNVGNGTDTMSVAASIGTGVTVTGYKYNGTTYATISALNTALASVGIPAGSSIAVDVVYDVAAGQGGKIIPVTVTQTSKRSPSTNDPTTTNVQPPVTGGVSVTPKSGTFDRLPSNGTQYSQVFPVTNNGNAQDTFTLLGAANADLTIVSVNGTNGTSGGNITLAAGASQNVTVVYTVNTNSPAGALDSLKLTATATANSATTDFGYIIVRTVRAAVTIAKQAFKDDKSTAISASTDKVLPGDYIQYKITVTNAAGAAAAQTVHVSDPLPSQVTYDSSSPDTTGWTLAQSSGTVTGDLTGTLAGGASRYFWIRVRVK